MTCTLYEYIVQFFTVQYPEREREWELAEQQEQRSTFLTILFYFFRYVIYYWAWSRNNFKCMFICWSNEDYSERRGEYSSLLSNIFPRLKGGWERRDMRREPATWCQKIPRHVIHLKRIAKRGEKNAQEGKVEDEKKWRKWKRMLWRKTDWRCGPDCSIIQVNEQTVLCRYLDPACFS